MREAAEAKTITSDLPLRDVYRLAAEHRAAGRLDEAELLLGQLLKARPKEPQAIHLLGIIAQQRGRLSEAIEQVKRAVALAPEAALFHANLGEMYRLAGRLDLALAHGRRALALQPDYPEVLSNIGLAHFEQKNYHEALACHRRAVALRPDSALAHSNMGHVLHALRRFDEAEQCYGRAVELRPDFGDGWSNLGTSLHHSGRYDEAIAALRRSLALDPNNANAHSGLGILLLMRGDFAEGLSEYEWRLQSTEVRLPYRPQRPWHGESLKGRRLYIHAEQGFGDVIQFARYVPLAAARGARITFRVQQGLVGLMRQSLEGIDILGDRSAPGSLPDCECALLSLPHLFDTRLETIPATIPYLRADPAEAAQWRERFAGLAGRKVGLVWGGNPEHINDRRRSIELTELACLLAVPGVSFVSLQTGPRRRELEKLREPAILDVSAELVGFAATAAALTALDLIISIDSAVAHLAGALGKPTWLLLPWVSDWRWLLHREDTPWYPTMRLFRQVEGQRWPAVAERVASELARVAAGENTALMPYRAASERRARQAAEIIAAIESRVAAPMPAPALSVPQLLALAKQRHRAGKLAEAEMLARRVLDAKPDSAEAYHLLSVVAHQSGNLAHAIEHVRRATGLAPDVALYHANLGEMCRLAGRLDEAIAEGERALALQPDFADAFNNLGIAHYERGEFDAAISRYRGAIELRPQSAEAHSNLGNALRATQRYDEAVVHYRHALELRPSFADAWNNLGTTLCDLRRYREAEQAYREALARKPDDPAMLKNLALCLKHLHRTDEAEAVLRRSRAIEGR